MDQTPVSDFPTPLDIAKVFTTGRSQAVRLPKAYRFDTTEVTIEKQGDAVILRPKTQTKEEFWAEFDRLLVPLDEFDVPERSHDNMRAPVDFE